MTTETLHGMLERWRDWNQTDMTPLTCAAEAQPLADQLQAVANEFRAECEQRKNSESEVSQGMCVAYAVAADKLQRILGTPEGRTT